MLGDKKNLIVDYKSVKNVLELLMEYCKCIKNWLCFYLAFKFIVL